MSETPPTVAPDQGLLARVLRPPVIRLKKSAAITLVLAGAMLLAGALTWSFVVVPQIRDAQRQAAREEDPPNAQQQARPSEIVTSQPASYDRLPAPRVLGGAPDARSEPPKPQPARAPHTPAPRSIAATDRREAERAALLFTLPHASPGRPPPEASAATSPEAFALKAGSIIPARLLSAIDTARPGPVVAVVSAEVFDSASGRRLLIPQGARLVGSHEGASRYGDRRVVLIWEQLQLPDGQTLALSRTPGVDAQGASGVEGRVDRRLGQLSIATLFAGAVTALGQAARDGDNEAGGLLLDVGDAAAIEAARVGGKLIDRELQVSPSIRLEAGAPVRALLTRDLHLKAWTP